jgi:hypothetical protein
MEMKRLMGQSAENILGRDVKTVSEAVGLQPKVKRDNKIQEIYECNDDVENENDKMEETVEEEDEEEIENLINRHQIGKEKKYEAEGFLSNLLRTSEVSDQVIVRTRRKPHVNIAKYFDSYMGFGLKKWTKTN